MSRKTKTQAELADRHQLYQNSVQDVESEIDFVEETFDDIRGREAVSLREDFCGTANTACEWVRRDPDHRAIAIDLDEEVLDWGRSHNLTSLDEDQRRRIELLCADVLTVRPEPVDAVLAMNFSYYLFMQREQLRRYFASVRRGLKPDGLFFMDAYGGYEAPREIEEERECEGFCYIWDQVSFNPINSEMECRIHFEFDDDSRLDSAFSYHWRLWTLPEIREILEEAGFSKSTVYWEGTDEETGEGDGIYSPSEIGDADAGWIAYLVAQP